MPKKKNTNTIDINRISHNTTRKQTTAVSIGPVRSGSDEDETNRDKLNFFASILYFLACMRKVSSNVIFINKIRVSLGQ